MTRLLLIVLITLTSAAVWAEDPSAEAACAAFSDDIFERLECEQRFEDGLLKRDETRARRAKLAEASGATPPASEFPVLVRMYGRPGSLNAQFRVGHGLVDVKSGAGLAGGWSVLTIQDASVVLRRGRDTRTVLIGGGRARPRSPDLDTAASDAPPVDDRVVVER